MKNVLSPEILKKAARKAYRLMYESGELQTIFCHSADVGYAPALALATRTWMIAKNQEAFRGEVKTLLDLMAQIYVSDWQPAASTKFTKSELFGSFFDDYQAALDEASESSYS